jgi:hypothetical protein
LALKLGEHGVTIRRGVVVGFVEGQNYPLSGDDVLPKLG